MTINEYTREFEARVQMYDELASNIGNKIKLQKAVCNEQLVWYTNMILDTTNSGKAK